MWPRRILQTGVALALLTAVGIASYLVYRLHSHHQLQSSLPRLYQQDVIWNQLSQSIGDFAHNRSPQRAEQAALKVLLDSISSLEESLQGLAGPIDFASLRHLIDRFPSTGGKPSPSRDRIPGLRRTDSLKTLVEDMTGTLDDRRRTLISRGDATLDEIEDMSWILLALVAGMGAGIAITSYRSGATVRQFRVATMQYAQGHFDYRLTERGAGEVRELIALFNTMGDQLQELERLKGEFFSKLVHDFKSPLDNIKQSADVLLGEIAEGSLNSQQRDFLRIIKRSATHLRTLVQEQLDESRLLAGQTELKYERLDIKPLILDRIQLQKPAALARRINFAIKFTDADFRVDCDRSKITRVIDNLLSNAIKYTRENSTITIELDDRIEGMVEFRIRDQGPGIPEAMQEKIFHKYVRLTHSGKTAGTGLGLFTAKYIVELHRGQIWVKSTEGEGAAFHVLLPKRLS